MKKMIALLLALLLLSGCGAQEPTETTQPAAEPAETEIPETTIPVPETVEASAEVNGAPAVLLTLRRGDAVDVVDIFDEKHYVVKTDAGYGLVEKNLIRLEDAPAFAPWNGYAYDQAAIYDNYRLAGTPVNRLAANTQVAVVENLGSCLMVQFGGSTGYMAPASLSRQSVGGGTGSGQKKQPDTGKDGGDISLDFRGGITQLSVLAPQEGSVSGRGKVLADGTDVILGYFDRGDTVPVVTESGFAPEKEGFYTVYCNGLYAWVAEDYLRMPGAEDYAAWDGYCQVQSAVYDNFWLQGSPVDRLDRNAQVKVLYELETCYLVEVADVTGYIAKDRLGLAPAPHPWQGSSGESQKKEEPAPPVEAPTEAPPTEEPPTEESPEWSPPML